MAHPAFRHALPELTELLGERLVTTGAIRDHHGRDESPLPPAPPDAVAFPSDESEVAEILRLCSGHGLPVVPFGAGTSLEGHVLATSGGVSVDLSQMNEIVEVNIADLDARVQAGVSRKQLEERLRRDGLFFPVDPGADATLGGMAATGASGTNSVRYGTIRHNVLSLRVALADGQVISTGGRARKSSAGYDLTRLFVGSEGTLGIITELTLRVYGIPEAIISGVCAFGSLDAAVGAVIVILQLGIPVARIELLDEKSMEAACTYSDLDYEIAPTLFFEFHGSERSVGEDSRNVEQVVTEFGAHRYLKSLDARERVRLWKARHDHFYASLALRPGARAITTDVCVPISRLPECITETRADVDASGLPATIAGHVGDGNFHVMMLIDPDSPEELAAAEEVNERLITRALAAGGTCSGEHGIGLRKVASLERELGPAVSVMRALKETLDPAGIMNPGKVFAYPLDR